MLRTFADHLYNKNTVIQWLKRMSPEEEVIFASAATWLETKEARPIGWSFRRLFQRRGVVIITRNQIAFKSSLLFFAPLLYLCLMALLLTMYFKSQNSAFLSPALLFGIFAMQFLPHQREIPFKEIQRIHIGEVQSIFSTGSLLTIYLRDKSINIVPAQFLSEEATKVISSRKA